MVTIQEVGQASRLSWDVLHPDAARRPVRQARRLPHYLDDHAYCMNDRTRRLRRQSLDTPPAISAERARLMTEFYQANHGRYSVPVMRARAFHHLCEHKTIYLGRRMS